ncbi:hypothetical protein DY138_04420 [Apilactobacillus timberlakei]|uniref:PH domain-containing protein n=1 Tax=Apilactobacillus timberlakei TaxID=2008380 RepID=UPI00112A88FE|nr:PH domain-containing protein [Apilactobacillus timberlakei]TPR18867.1 hypothetical protein DY138_04420 [Apilactobacillus timberlakei]TPR20969.1 hypothetical protein DY061_02720 [Apilactobacillus timberlakei]TPR23620.1 hypothetical protein DY083_00590 [Apilactobacillus timberlakei]
MQNKLLNPLSLLFGLRNYFSQVIGIFAISIWIRIIWLTPIFALFLFVYNIAAYFSYRYSILDEQLLVKRGIFFKKEIHMPYEKIQNIHRKQWFFLKPFSLEEVIVDNASRSDSNINLIAVNENVAKILENKKAIAINSKPENKITKSDVNNSFDAQYRISNHSMNLFALTSFRGLFGLFILFEFYQRYSFAISAKYKDAFFNYLGSKGIIIIILEIVILLIIAFVVSYISIWIQYYRFTLTKKDGYLTFSRGLLKKETLRINIKRIQSINFSQNIIRSLFKLTTVKITIISDRKESTNTKDPIVIPVLNSKNLYTITNQFFDNLPPKDPKILGQRAYSIWLFIRNSLWTLLLPLPLLLNGNNWLTMFFFIEIMILVAVIFNGFYRYRHNGVKVIKNDDLVIENCRFFNRHLHFINWHCIQSITLRESIWMQKKNLAHLKISERRGDTSGEILAKYIDLDVARSIYDWYQNQ